MKIYTIEPIGFACNSYLLTQDDKTAILIDAAQPRVLKFAQEYGLKVKYVLLTHGHFDHIGGCLFLAKEGAEIFCSQQEKEVIEGKSCMAELSIERIYPFPFSATLQDGQELELCGIKIKVIATPGHTQGGLTFQIENKLFTGDSLFKGCIGRTDLPTGDEETLEKSIKKLYALDGDYEVFPGHGNPTTLEIERKTNMCIRA